MAVDYCVITLKRSKSNYQHPTRGVQRRGIIMCAGLLSKRIPLVVSQQDGSQGALRILCGQALCLRVLLWPLLLWPDSHSKKISFCCSASSLRHLSPRNFCWIQPCALNTTMCLALTHPCIISVCAGIISSHPLSATLMSTCNMPVIMVNERVTMAWSAIAWLHQSEWEIRKVHNSI